MKTSYALLLIGFAANAAAQDNDAAVRSRAEIENEVDVLERQIERREQRVAELTNDMLAFDARTEARTAGILESIAKVTDSVESGTHIARTKHDAIEALKHCAEHYRDQSKTLRLETLQRKPRLTRGELFDDIGRFDKRVEERIEQVIMLVNSMQQHQDYDKWTGEDGLFRYRNPRWEHNRREAGYTEREREQLLEEFEEEIRDLQARNRKIRTEVDADITPQYRVILLNELDDNTARIERRQQQIVEVAFPAEPETTPAGRDQAYTIDSVVDEMAEDLETDCRAIWRAYVEIVHERQILNQTRERLLENLMELELLDTPSN